MDKKGKPWIEISVFVAVTTLAMGLITALIYFGTKNKVPEPNKADESSKISEFVTNVTESITNKSSAGVVRKAGFAGEFYPKDANKLKTQLDSYLEQVEKSDKSGKPRIIIVPHAGIEYSGGVASAAFKEIQGKNYSRVVLIGAAHKPDSKTGKPINYAAVYTKGSWETPLGTTEVDDVFANKLVEVDQNIKPSTEAHEEEHSLELELIFLQSVLQNFKIVPIMLGTTSTNLSDLLALKLAYLMDDNTLIVVSTDLSHYPTWEKANYSDNKVIEAILTGNHVEFEKTVQALEWERITNLDTVACGKEAVKVALKTAEHLQIKDFVNLKYQNSGDVSGDKTRVVGYAAIGAWKETIPGIDFSDATRDEMIGISYETLVSYLSSGSINEIETDNPYLHLPIGVFTTLKNKGNLRGCIGEFEPNKPLYQVIQSTTISAASKDPRFSPVKLTEITDIEIEISLMTSRRKVDSWKDIEIGKHGVVITQGAKSGTFLPQVATDNNWDRIKFLEELCVQKAGLDKNCYMDSKTEIQVFEALIIKQETTEKPS